MAYIPTNWVNDTTELRAENMNKIEMGIVNAYGHWLLAVSDTEPTECYTGDEYYNTTTKKIYTAVGVDDWGITGRNPETGVFYIVFDTQTVYSFDGTDMVSVGGGSGSSDIIMVQEEPTEDTKLVIEDIDLDGQYTESDYYSTEETLTNKVWIDGKPIYRKVVTFTTDATAGSWKNYPSGITSTVDKMISIQATIERSNYINSVPYEESANGYIYLSYVKGSKNVTYKVGSDLTSLPVIVILEYTKTGGNN